MTIQDKKNKYTICMDEIKKRVEVVESILDNKVSTPYLITTVELICIQIRKILELIALSSLVANKEEYQKVKDNINSAWRTKNILKDLSTINPNYYPQPITLQCWNGDINNTRTQPVETGFLTREELLNIYSICGGLLHAQNPFAHKKQFENILKQVPSWLKKIKKLTNVHVVQLVDESTMFITIINFDYEKDVSVGVYDRQ
ncbi:MAG: hypothetical protein ACNI28_02890 [Arcobacter sp.]|uniref:hypothetical protein n=1 Tax=Arcobacter sp. TaxID=1872629 RepID=UPI003B008031